MTMKFLPKPFQSWETTLLKIIKSFWGYGLISHQENCLDNWYIIDRHGALHNIKIKFIWY